MCLNDRRDGENFSMEATTKTDDASHDLDVYRSPVLVHGADARSDDQSSHRPNCDRDGCDDWCFCCLAGA